MKISMRTLAVAALVATAAAQRLGGAISVQPVGGRGAGDIFGGSTDCPANERFARCYSSSCKESRCVDGAVVEPGMMCTMDCRQGCVCSQGFARMGRECVSYDECTGSGSQVEVELCEDSPGSMCRMMCREPYMCGEGQCAVLGAGGAMPCCNNYECQDDTPTTVGDPRCAGKECGDVCSTNGLSSTVLTRPIGRVGLTGIGRRLTSIMAPDVMMYCQADGSCGMNSRPDCGDDDVEIPERYPDPRCPAPVEGMASICSIDPTCNVRGACERQGKICCSRACGGLECVFPPEDATDEPADPCDVVNIGPDPHRVCDGVEGCAYNFQRRRCERETDEPNQCEQMGCAEDPCCECHNGMVMMMGCAQPAMCADGRDPVPAPGQCCATPNDCRGPEPNQCERMGCNDDPCCECLDGFPAMMDCMPFRCPNGEMAQAPAGQCCGGPRDCPADGPCPDGIMRCGGFRPTPELLEACTEDERIYTPGPECTEGCETWTCPETEAPTEEPVDLCANNPYIGMSKRDVTRAKKQAKKTIKKYNKLQGKVDAANESKAAKLQRKLDRMAGDLAEAQLIDAQIKALKKC